MTNRANYRQSGRPDDLRTLLDAVGDVSAGRGPLFRRLTRAVASAVDRGTLARGSRLPADRRLARALGVSRGTVVAAYDALVADGVVERRRGSGTFVLGPDTLGLPPGREGSALVHRLVDRSTGLSPVIDLSLSVLGDATGLPDVSVTSGDLLRVTPETGYTPWGLPGLRAALADRVTAWGLPTEPDQVVVTTGAQQAVAAAASCWVRPGDVVAVDDPTYPGAISALSQAGAQLVPMEVDGAGVRPEAVARALAHRPALVYLQSGPHSPTGAVLSEPRRRAIADLVVSARVPLVEDAALAELAWRDVPAPVASWCGAAAVALIGSLGKVFWGGLRVGFVRAPAPVALRFARVKATQDLGSSAVSQVMAERLLAADDPSSVGFVDRRRQALRQNYDVLAAELGRQLPDWDWNLPQGGLSVWVRLPGDAGAFAQTALRHGVAVATQDPLSCSGSHRDRVRLSFSPAPEVIVEGVHRLAHAWRANR